MSDAEIPIAELRRCARAAAERTTVRRLSETVGVGRTTLQNFVRGGTHPHPRTRRALVTAYLAERAEREEPPPWNLPEVRLAPIVLARAHQSAGEPIPEWLDRITRQSAES